MRKYNREKTYQVIWFAVIMLSLPGLFQSCSGQGGDTRPPQKNETLQGVFSDSQVEGITFETAKISGITDKNGVFFYHAGEEVSFSLAGVLLGKTQGKQMVSPVDLVKGAIDETNLIVTNISRFLLTLDQDCDPSNGIAISASIRDAITGKTVDFATGMEDFEKNTASIFSALSFQNLYACGEVRLCSIDFARRHLRTTLRETPQFKLTIKTGGDVTVVAEPDLDFYDDGEVVTLTAVAGDGWTFTNWLGDAYPYDNPAMIVMNADKAVVAVSRTEAGHFQVPVVLRIHEVGAGTVDLNPPGGTYHADPHGYINKNTVVTLTAIHNPGWIFDHWEGDLTSRESLETIIMDAFKDVTAVFVPVPENQRTINVEKEGSGAVRLEPQGGIYYGGAKVKVAAMADEGWEFTKWGGDLSGSDPAQTLLMNSDHTVFAQFAEIPGVKYRLTAITDRGTVVSFWPPAQLTYEGSTIEGMYKPGTAVTVTASTRPGYRFVAWGGDLSGAENPVTIIMDNNKIMTLSSTESP